MGRPLALAASDARAIAIAAQGLAAARPARVTTATIGAAIRRLGVLQIDSVNVLQRSHYLPLWSRLGNYDTAALDRMSHEGPRSLFEYWGHEASLLPVATQPLLRWRMARAKEDAWKSVRDIRKRRSLVARVLREVRDRGPLRAGEIESGPPRREGWWSWSDAKIAIEWLFWSGRVTSARRRGFERLYDLPERVLPPEVIATPTPRPADAIRTLVATGAAALGIATARDLRDYFRLPDAESKAALAELVEDGVLEVATVEGWTKPAFRHRDAAPGTIDRARAALLTPFDSLVWCRERTERLFGMRYRIEIYTPAPQRVYGYYVLPFLLGDALVARVDLKADREARVLRVLATHGELGAPVHTAEALGTELAGMARWLGLDTVDVAKRGSLAPALRQLTRR